MSYCRWSSDDFQCDLYIYRSMDGYVTHVAGGRRTFNVELPPPVSIVYDGVDAWVERDNILHELIDHHSEVLPIGLPLDGEDFTDATAGECADRAEELRALGYLVPQYSIDNLRAEHDGAT